MERLGGWVVGPVGAREGLRPFSGGAVRGRAVLVFCQRERGVREHKHQESQGGKAVLGSG